MREGSEHTDNQPLLVVMYSEALEFKLAKGTNAITSASLPPAPFPVA